MKKFSHSDLLNNAILSSTGEILNGIFQSKYQRIHLELPKYDYIRGKVLVNDINDLSEANEKMYFEDLILLLIRDFLNQVQRGMDLNVLGKSIISKKQQQEEENKKSIRNLVQQNKYSYVIQEHKIQNKNPMIQISFKMMKKYVYRGEILLYDLSEIFPEIEITFEELISIYYRDFIAKVKNGDTEILRNMIINSSR